ncbi:MAG: hydrogenase iron-sulfur subunit [Pseudomonadota bacterium]
MIDITISKDVLVIGSGQTGLDSAVRVASQGYPVLFVDQKSVSASAVDLSGAAGAQIEVMTGTRIRTLAGVAGDFRATLDSGKAVVERKFGAIVVAPEYQWEALNERYGLPLNDRIINQSQMEAMLADPEGQARLKNGSGSCVAFLSGFGQEGTPAATQRVLESALAVQNLENCRAYIYAGNIKVGGKGLERLFTTGRHAGVVCFKPETRPVVQTDSGSLKIISRDPVVRTDVELEPDYIVIEEGLAVDDIDRALADVLRIDADGEGFVPSNNVHRFPARSNREGIYVAAAPGEAANVALRVKEFIGDGVRQVVEDRAKVNENRCVICLTCYRCCPHGAIFWEKGAAAISPVACQGCGICASECPMDAIQLGAFSDDSLKAGIAKALESAPVSGPSIVAFCCENSALEAGEAAKAFGAEMPEGLRMIQVPCAGKVDVEFIMNAFVEGADGVMVFACHEGNCKAERGNIYARWRVNEVRKRLAAMGLNKNRLIFTTTAANMADDFAAKVNAFAGTL